MVLTLLYCDHNAPEQLFKLIAIKFPMGDGTVHIKMLVITVLIYL